MRFSLLLCGVFLSFSAFAKSTQPNLTTSQLQNQRAYLANINQCSSPRKLSGLINQAILLGDNVVAKAKSASVFEEVMLHNPACFLQALNQLPTRQCELAQGMFIEETFFYPRDEIKQSLARARGYKQSCLAS